LDIANPLSLTNFASNWVAGALNPHPSYARKDNFYRYDAVGNVLEQGPEDGVRTSYIWGHGQTLPIAEVVNAPANQIFHTSFEEATTTDILTGGAKTGERYLQLGTNQTTYQLIGTGALPKGTYTLSYWWRADASDELSWELVETTVSKENDQEILAINLSGPGRQVDEVRVYPAGALMTTYTYRPLVGMTSSMDPNHVVTYFEYDGLGRLRYVRDQDRNLIKTYEYNYKQ
jgi:YD repeat-containing protein